MKSLINTNLYYSNYDFNLYFGDNQEILPRFESNSVDLIFADPPYFLSNGGITCKAGKVVSVDKANWDKSKGFEKDLEFTQRWLSQSKRILKDNGSIWVSGTLHNIYKVGYSLQKLGFKILNEIIWYKSNAPPNISCRYFTHSHETLLWARKSPYVPHKYNYDLMKSWSSKSDKINFKDKQMRSVWQIPLTPSWEKEAGKHPTQKPIELLKRVILSSSNKGDLVLDPFNGSGTTGLVAKKYNRKYIGIDTEKEYLDLTLKRIGG